MHSTENRAAAATVLWLLLLCLFSLRALAQPSKTIALAAVSDVLLDRGVRRDLGRIGLQHPFLLPKSFEAHGVSSSPQMFAMRLYAGRGA
jgi:hypothetical protein